MNLDNLRYEIKFIADPTDNYIFSFLENHSWAFREVFYPRTVHNYYCDSESLSAYEENLTGVSERVKVRYRWYTSERELTPSKITAEIKYKTGKVGGKKLIPLDITPVGHSSREIVKNGILNCSQEFLPYLSTYSTPTLYNEYKRTYFLSADSKIRVTLDDNISFAPLMFGENSLRRHDLRPFRIIEVKGEARYSEEISKVLSSFPYRPYRFSKYVVGIQNGIFG